ncbi:DUF1413 domain-containing protein [Staphylococcus croceilyticus]|uniref:DUF1413 domain-containing protein n=1 Tax=Staphylococcus croceilyticus TaxID=319942 RepID=A0ABY2KGY6_9STAP|nr:DUF1413 domain-containing protein [Staphylococcus croceilyticus]PNZ66221.1 hypothetical protein CD128_10665 [Staphylococcus croceilyticus]TGA80606.1 DUF1413 domain-containing protein [Staphylococcus croceilyticus]
MNFEERIQALRADKSRTSFSFRFEELYTEEEWLGMSVKQRTRQEREFNLRLDRIPNVRMPFASEDGIKVKLYNQVYDYNEVKKNFKEQF